MKRWEIVAVVTTGLCLSLLIAVGLLVLAGREWPDIVEFNVVNGSGEDIKITPVGVTGSSGQCRPLPRFDSLESRFPSRNTCDLPVPADGRLTIYYELKDINFRCLLVRRASGELLILPTDERGDAYTWWPPQQSEYRIPPLDQLAKAPDELVPCAAGNAVTYSGMKEH